ncbi:SDR family oxidoreductase [Symbiobacterium sp.]|uniref:elongation factor P 5-aminopentanone reductase n=1 Tax=Symbiobacterium sp. TaxID=1971213 RepID=UPI003463E34B
MEPSGMEALARTGLVPDAPCELAGQAALVTGASRGIGRAIALALAAGGARVMVGYLRQREKAEAVVEQICRAGGEAEAIQVDVRDAAACEAAVAATVRRFGQIDVLVNNAGTALEKLLVDTSLDEWDDLVAVHLTGMYACTRAALPHMMARRYGRVITISSIWGITGAAGEVAYSAVKAGQNGFTRALAQEVGPFGITVNAVAPGAIDTEMNQFLQGDDLADWLARVPVRRLGTPEEVASLVRYLAGPQAGFITGQVISPNGGVVV